MAAEIAAALTLAVGAGLLVQSLIRLASVDLGFQIARRAPRSPCDPPETKYRDEAARVAFFAEIERRVASMPGRRLGRGRERVSRCAAADRAG